MTNYSLTDIRDVINQHTEAQETLGAQLFKAKALACITATEDFLDFEPPVIQGCFLMLIDLLTEAQKLNDETISSFMKNTKELGLL